MFCSNPSAHHAVLIAYSNRSNGNRSSITSQTAAPATPVSTAPRYVAELTEYQTVLADIPPLVKSSSEYKLYI